MSDSEIIELFYARSEKAITELKYIYGKYCYKIANNILSNNEDVEECMNDTYLSVWNSIPPNTPNSLLSYIGKITRNIALDKYRTENARKRGGGEINLVLEELKEFISSKNNIEKELENKEIIKVINNFLETMEKEKRVIFVLRYYYSENIKMISYKLGISESKIKSILFRIRKELKKHLDEEGIIL